MVEGRRQHRNRVVAIVASIALVVGLTPLPAAAASGSDPGRQAPGAASAVEPAASAATGNAGAKADEAGKAGAIGKSKAPGKAGDPEQAAPAAEEGEAAANAQAAQPAAEPVDAKAQLPAFRQSKTVGGVAVTVEAGAGAFPEGAGLSVASVPSSRTEAAVAPERDENENVAASYTFDIKVLGADGAELQPADGKSVRVSFAAAEVADPNLETSVYHVSGGEAEELAVSESGSTATATSGGFSYYTVEFTYGELQYVLPGGGSVPLADVLAEVGLQGEPTDAASSAPELFSVEKGDGAWTVSARRAFTSAETLTVTVNGAEYAISVTDSQFDTLDGGLTWTLDDEGTLTISGAGAIPDFQAGGAPWFYSRDGVKAVVIKPGVTSIGTNAFYLCMSLEGVTIPSSVTSIGTNAFYLCTSLEGVTIPNGVTSIGRHAFADCKSLASVEIPSSVTSIGDRAFYDCPSLASVEIPSGVTSIGEGAFRECTKLGSVEIPSSVTYIGKEAFYDCFSLKSVTIPDGVTSIGEGAFHGCYSLKDVYFFGTPNQWNGFAAASSLPDGATVHYRCGDGVYYTLDDSGTLTISKVGDGTGRMDDFESENAPWYRSCNNIKAAVIGDGVTSIGSFAFESCSLKSVAIPNSVTSIGNGAFSSCSLESIEIPSSVTSIGSHAFADSCLTSVEIPGSVTSIEDSAFENCSSLKSVSIPASVGTIGPRAFFNCSCRDFTSVTIPGSITHIGNGAFGRCDSLKDIFVDTDESIITGESWSGNAEVHWRHEVTTEASPEAGGTVEVTPASSSGTYWDKDPGTLDPTKITVAVEPKLGYFLSKLTYKAEGSTEETDITSEKSFDMPNADVTVKARFEPKTKITITAGSGEWTYDGGKHANTSVTVTGGKLPDGDELEASATGSVTNVADTKEGNNPIKPGYKVMRGSEDVTGEYDITAVAGTLTIKPAPLTITAIDQTYNFNGQTQGEGDTAYEDAAEIAEKVKVEGLQGNDMLTGITLDGQGKDVGEYELVPSNAAIGKNTGNYAITYVNGTLTIEPAPVQEYTVAFANWDGTVLQSGKVAKGQVPKFEGAEPTRPSDESYTYAFAGWEPAIAAVTGDATYTAKFTATPKPAYKVVTGAGGAWTQGSSAPLAFKIERTVDPETAFGHFTGVLVDGRAVPEKDASGKANWTARSGSVIVELQPPYLATLSAGKHTLTVTFDDADPVSADFTVSAKAATPATGDPLPGTAAVLAVVALVALGAAVAAFVVRRRIRG